MSTLPRITASGTGTALSIFAGEIQASTMTRTLVGTVVKYGVPGRTSAGLLRVRAGALRFPEPLNRVKLTKEHDRAHSRGHLAVLQDDGTTLRAAMRVADGPEGDDALREADPNNPVRDGLSIDVVDAVLEGDEIVDALVIAIGQVGIPAYDDSRIDTVAASQSQQSPINNQGVRMTPEQRARLAALRAQQNRTPEEEAELQQLVALEQAEQGQQASASQTDGNSQQANAPPAAPSPAAGQQQGDGVTASVPVVPGGVPRPTSSTQVRERSGSALTRMVTALTAGMAARDVTQITAALQDITHTNHTADIEEPAWSGELWSGLQYEPEFLDLFSTGTLTNWHGRGWRFTSKLEIQDYAGDKAEIPSDNVTTEDSVYEAARMAVGVDIDRKFYDFPNEGFVQSLVEQVRESWTMKLDAKVRAYAIANAVPLMDTVPEPDVPYVAPTLLKAAARASMALKRRKVGRASWIVVNDEDMFTLLDIAEKDVPVFLDLYGIDPRNFRSSDQVPQGTVLAGRKEVAQVRTLPGSPIRVSAQHLANGGVDEAFFGYWAIEEHHTSGIASVQFAAA